MRIIDCEQRSDAWFKAKAGKVSCSNVWRIFAGKNTATYQNYLYKLARETRSGEYIKDDYTNKWMERGTEQEDFARTAYEKSMYLFVDKVGLVIHPTIDRFVFSPDGLMLDIMGGIEIKVPTMARHDAFIRGEKNIDSDWKDQIHSGLACIPEIEWIDFVSYCPEEEDNLKMFKRRFTRDQERIEKIENQVKIFLSEVDMVVKDLLKISNEVKQ